jgi:hypothetical protein
MHQYQFLNKDEHFQNLYISATENIFAIAIRFDHKPHRWRNG